MIFELHLIVLITQKISLLFFVTSPKTAKSIVTNPKTAKLTNLKSSDFEEKITGYYFFLIFELNALLTSNDIIEICQ